MDTDKGLQVNELPTATCAIEVDGRVLAMLRRITEETGLALHAAVLLALRQGLLTDTR